jgi:hypothetical protein
MDIDVREFAQKRNISERRVLQLIEQGDLRARKLSSRWLIDAAELSNPSNLARPMSPKMSKAFLDLLSKSELPVLLDSAEKFRLRKRFVLLKQHQEPALLLKSWLRKRAENRHYGINVKDLNQIRQEPKIIPSGVSDPRSGLSANNFFEGYVNKNWIKAVEKKYLLVPSNKPNVILRIVDEELSRPIPYGYLLADLAEHYEARDRAQVSFLLKKI